MSINTINVNTLSTLRKAMEMALDTAIAILEMHPDAKKLDDSGDKFAHIRAERIVRTACEFLDSKSWANDSLIHAKSDAYKAAKARVNARVATK